MQVRRQARGKADGQVEAQADANRRYLVPGLERGYRLGRAVLRLGFESLASLELPELARPVMGRLRERCNCPVSVMQGAPR